MRWRSMLFAGAAVLAVTHVVGVLLGGALWRFAEVGTLVLLGGYAAVVGTPRWLGPVALSPLLVDALLRIPPATPPTYGWQLISTGQQHRNLVMDALDESFRLAGPVLLTVLTVLLAHRAAVGRSAWPRWRAVVFSMAGVAIVGYAMVRVGRIVGYLHGHPTDRSSSLAVVVAVLVPVSLALAALALAGQGPAGAALIAVAAIPLIDSAVASVPVPYAVFDRGIYVATAISRTAVLQAPGPAVTEALLLAGVFCAVRGVRRSGG